jgi:hypothetical protein
MIMLAAAAGCQRDANARTSTGAGIAAVIDSLESSNESTERLLDSARLQLDSALQTMVDIAALTDRLAGQPVDVVAQAHGEGGITPRPDLSALRARSLKRLDAIQRRLEKVNVSLSTVRDTSRILRDEVVRLTRTVASLTRGTVAQEARLQQLSASLLRMEAERDRALATSERQQRRADTLRDVLDYTLASTQAREDSVFLLIGDAPTLARLGVAERTGGVVGLGKVLKLRGDFPRDAFSVLSKKESRSLKMPAPGRQYRIISPHQASCFTWSTADSTTVLRVLDADCFWEGSRYLVIEERK